MASTMAASRPTSRRRYSAELKAQVLAQCDVPGASVAQVAMSHGINANVVHRWRQLVREGRTELCFAGVLSPEAGTAVGGRESSAPPLVELLNDDDDPREVFETVERSGIIRVVVHAKCCRVGSRRGVGE